MLNKKGIEARVVEIYTLKPFDKDLVINCAKQTGAIVAIEEHSVIGGLYGALSETHAKTYPIPVVPIVIDDNFVKTAMDFEGFWITVV